MKCNSKPILSVLLLVLFFGYTFSGILTYADFYINKDFIANILCENKDKPEMHCQGHCYLGKQLDKENNEQSPVNTSHKTTNEIQLYSEDVSDFSYLFPETINESEKINHYLFPVTDKHITSIFRPPCV